MVYLIANQSQRHICSVTTQANENIRTILPLQRLGINTAKGQEGHGERVVRQRSVEEGLQSHEH